MSVEPPARILVVDDLRANLITMKAVFDSPDYELVLVNSGADAVKAVEAQDFAVILLDVQMPVMDGFETATRIKKIDRARNIPILFVTAIDHPAARVTLAYKTGAIDFIQKPFDPEIMRAKVAVFVELYRAQDKARRDESALRETHTSLIGREQKVREEADRLATSLEQVGRLKQDFLSALGQELRTPLNTILAWTRMLRDGSVPEAHRSRALETVERNAEAQLELIDDMLDLSRIASGTLSLTLTTVDLVKIAEQAIESMRDAAAKKRVALHAELERDLAPMSGDADRLRQIAIQLIRNAISSTPSGGKVSISIARSGSQVELAVKDTGEGIAPALLPNVFDAGSQRGMGVKLAIVRHLVELHEGTIHAESEGPGLGSELYVRLPAR